MIFHLVGNCTHYKYKKTIKSSPDIQITNNFMIGKGKVDDKSDRQFNSG